MDQERKIIEKWRCIPCDYVYDPAEGDSDAGIPAGTAFEDLPGDWEGPSAEWGKISLKKWINPIREKYAYNSALYYSFKYTEDLLIIM